MSRTQAYQNQYPLIYNCAPTGRVTLLRRHFGESISIHQTGFRYPKHSCNASRFIINVIIARNTQSREVLVCALVDLSKYAAVYFWTICCCDIRGVNNPILFHLTKRALLWNKFGVMAIIRHAASRYRHGEREI